MSEVQTHGFVFEKWVRETFFNKYETTYGAKWDVAKEANTIYGNLPVSIKTAKYGSSIYLGDAIRQYSINEDFILLVGFWKQEEGKKRIVNVAAPVIKVSLWQDLWLPLIKKEIIALDNLIKSYDKPYYKIRKAAQEMKSTSPYCDCKITLNPKIDSKTQRRLQCSINFNLFFDEIATCFQREEIEHPMLWAKEVPEPWESKSRTFNKKY